MWKDWQQVCREIRSHSFGDGGSECHEGPSCIPELFAIPWSGFPNFSRGVWPGHQREDRDRIADLGAVVVAFWVFEQMQSPSLSCLEELARQECQMIGAYESGAHGKPNWEGLCQVVHQRAYPLTFRRGCCRSRTRCRERQTDKKKGKGKKEARQLAGSSAPDQ